MHRRGPSRDRLPPQVLARRDRRPDRLPPLRSQRAGRAGVHAAAQTEPIKSHPTVRELYAGQLVAQGVLTQEQANEMQDLATARIDRGAQERARTRAHELTAARRRAGTRQRAGARHRSRQGRLLRWTAALISVPDGFTVNRKLVSAVRQTHDQAIKQQAKSIGVAEALAFASLLGEGTPIRLTGQDTGRGTFSTATPNSTTRAPTRGTSHCSTWTVQRPRSNSTTRR